MCDFASYIAAFEHPQMPRTSRSKRGRLAAAILAAAPPERVAAAIVELVFARPPIEVPPTPGAKAHLLRRLRVLEPRNHLMPPRSGWSV